MVQGNTRATHVDSNRSLWTHGDSTGSGSEDALGTGDLVACDGDGLSQRACERFEDGFGDVVIVEGVVVGGDFDVAVEAALVDDRLEELADELGVEGADFGALAGEAGIENQSGSSGEVDADTGECFVHGDGGETESFDAFFVAEGLLDGLAEDDTDVFDGVVIIDVGIAGGVDGEAEATVFREVIEHVVEESDAGVVAGIAPIEGKGEVDIGFVGFALDVCGSGHV